MTRILLDWQAIDPSTKDFGQLAAIEFRDGHRFEIDEAGMPHQIIQGPPPEIDVSLELFSAGWCVSFRPRDGTNAFSFGGMPLEEALEWIRTRLKTP